MKFDNYKLDQMKVGHRYPIQSPPIDAQSLELAVIGDPSQSSIKGRNGEEIVIGSPQLLFKIWLSEPVEFEKIALSNKCPAYGLYSSVAFPDGIPTFVFAEGRQTFVVNAPLVAEPELVSLWCREQVSNGIHFHLINRDTGILEQMRVIGMAKSYMEALSSVWSADLKRHPLSTARYNEFIQTTDDVSLWQQSRKWFFNDDTDEFEEE
jgi:hypothetical protein